MSVQIILENYSGVYYAGSEIRGRLECHFTDETTVRGIKIRIKCKEHNSWSGTETYTDPSDHKTKTRHITFTGDNHVLSIEKMLYGSDSGTRELSRGRHVYPFNYTLPSDLPTTFNGPHGHISYKIKAIVDRPMRTDYESEFMFVVQSPIDFNKMPQELQDINTYSDEKSVCCWCCQGGKVSMDVELPRIGFVPGEKIPFKISICNLSNSNVESLKVKLIKTITYSVTSPHHETKEDVDNLISFTEHGVGAHGEYTYNLELAIPTHVEVPNFTKCKLFKVSYELKASAEMPTCTLDLDVNAWDIQIGHVPCAPPDISAEDAFAPPPSYVPPAGGFVPPPGGFAPPPQGGFVPPPGGFAPPPQGGFVPPPGGYPPPQSGFAPPPAGSYPPYPGYPPEKGIPAGPPSAPSSSIASAPAEDPKAAEAARFGPPGPYNGVPEMPPPSYNQVQQNSAPYPPQ